MPFPATLAAMFNSDIIEGSGVGSSGQAYSLEGANMTPTTEYIAKVKERLEAGLDKSPGQGPHGNCWEWRGAKTNGGYGQLTIDGQTRRVPRMSYLVAHGTIDDSLQVMHSCDNPPCANPDHLTQGTSKDNQNDCVRKMRHGNTRKTHCPRGHEYTPENTGSNGPGKRRCKKCFHAYYLKLQRRKRAENAVPERPTGSL